MERIEKHTQIKNKYSNGITMIALIVTIVILLILAGITIGTLTGENGLIGNSKEAKESTEIANEKEVLEQATIKAMGEEKYGEISEENLKKALENITGEGKVEIGKTEKGFEVGFIESKRYYEIDEEGNIGNYQIATQDKYPGDITKDENGNILDGSLEHPFEINCIEDLVVFSNMTNGDGVMFENGSLKEVTARESFENKYVVLKRKLNFKSNFSYINSQRTDFGDINGNAEDDNTLMNEMTTNTGFRPICDFAGSFNGNNYEIQNIYINTEGVAGLFISNGTQIERIENLGVTGKIISTKSNAAGIAIAIATQQGLSVAGNIENCWNKAEIQGSGWVAGIIQASNETIKNCYNTGNITNNATNRTYWRNSSRTWWLRNRKLL